MHCARGSCDLKVTVCLSNALICSKSFDLMLWFPFCDFAFCIPNSPNWRIKKNTANFLPSWVPLPFVSQLFFSVVHIRFFFSVFIARGMYQKINVHLNAIPLWHQANTKQKPIDCYLKISIYWYATELRYEWDLLCMDHKQMNEQKRRKKKKIRAKETMQITCKQNCFFPFQFQTNAIAVKPR